MKWINAFLCYRQQRVVVNGVKSDWAPVVSGVQQGTVLGPLLFSLHINDITADIESEIRLFADDCVCYREMKDKEDTLKLQRDIDRLGNWARKWGMRFQPVKCNMMQLTRKYLNKIQASYTLEGAVYLRSPYLIIISAICHCHSFKNELVLVLNTAWRKQPIADYVSNHNRTCGESVSENSE